MWLDKISCMVNREWAGNSRSEGRLLVYNIKILDQAGERPFPIINTISYSPPPRGDLEISEIILVMSRSQTTMKPPSFRSWAGLPCQCLDDGKAWEDRAGIKSTEWFPGRAALARKEGLFWSLLPPNSTPASERRSWAARECLGDIETPGQDRGCFLVELVRLKFNDVRALTSKEGTTCLIKKGALAPLLLVAGHLCDFISNHFFNQLWKILINPALDHRFS